jgi:CheY-like chemotaxis protein
MNARILVIEDNEINLELVTDLLEANGFQVDRARTAEEGLGLARQFLPELVLLDLSLPGMDGLAAARALRADPVINDLRVIALTAHAMKGDEATALEAGCDAYLTKPINTRTFPEQIKRFIGTARASLRTTISHS